MFIRTTKVKGHIYVRLVESYRKDGKVKQRYISTICSGETWGINGAASDFVDMVADILRDSTDIADGVTGSKKQTENMLKARAQDLLDDFERAHPMPLAPEDRRNAERYVVIGWV